MRTGNLAREGERGGCLVLQREVVTNIEVDVSLYAIRAVLMSALQNYMK